MKLSLIHSDITLAFVVALIITSPFVWHVYGQQPKVKPKTLNPIASARIIEIETQIANLRSSERDVLDGAGVPRDWGCGWNAEKIVTCAAPVASPSPKVKE